MRQGTVRTIAICLFRDGDRLLVAEGYDAAKGDTYYRPPGGTVEFGEFTRDTVTREIREELGLGVTDLRLLTVIENLFTCNGAQGHEIVFVYEGRFADPRAYQSPVLDAHEDDGKPYRAEWRSLDTFDATHRLVPDALREVLAADPVFPPKEMTL
jgi:ADP-ribose pyrophosphatase YjhB (NUDIX family)